MTFSYHIPPIQPPLIIMLSLITLAITIVTFLYLFHCSSDTLLHMVNNILYCLLDWFIKLITVYKYPMDHFLLSLPTISCISLRVIMVYKWTLSKSDPLCGTKMDLQEEGFKFVCLTPDLKLHGGHDGHCPLIGRDALCKRKIITAKMAVPYFPHWPLSSVIVKWTLNVQIEIQ